MAYEAPKITDFGSIEFRVHTLNFSPNNHDEVDENTNGGTVPTSAGGDGGSGVGLGLIGVAGTVIAIMASRRDNEQEANTGRVKEEEEESVSK